ncbi:hypothetical protein N0V90_007269 [Kalmusia sp. IMI 367209]|nr:hypothetical protein N0V90_007269 [Kalmusia sp. IMI 367209]
MRTEPATRESLTTEGGFLEAWAQGYNVGSLIILILIVFCNYRSGILLHKLILLELVLALWHGTFIFVEDPAYGWYLSSTAALLFISYQLHNVVSWLKIRPFLPVWGSRVFIFSLLAVQPFWVAEAWSNFEYFNGLGSDVNVRMRPFEALLRDPWWIFTTWKLISAIKKTYGFNIWALMKINSRFGVMLACMFISIAFLLTDVAVNAAHITASSGINPYWRFALVFKCASDTIFLDDFKSVLDDIIARKLSSAGGGTCHNGTHNGRDTRKRSYSYIRGDPPLADSTPTSVPAVEMPSHEYKSKRSFNPFKSHGRKETIPRIQVQREMTVTSEVRKPSHDSWHSEQGLVRSPEAVVHGPRKQVTSVAGAGSPAPGLWKSGYEMR